MLCVLFSRCKNDVMDVVCTSVRNKYGQMRCIEDPLSSKLVATSCSYSTDNPAQLADKVIKACLDMCI